MTNCPIFSLFSSSLSLSVLLYVFLCLNLNYFRSSSLLPYAYSTFSSLSSSFSPSFFFLSSFFCSLLHILLSLSYSPFLSYTCPLFSFCSPLLIFCPSLLFYFPSSFLNILFSFRYIHLLRCA